MDPATYQRLTVTHPALRVKKAPKRILDREHLDQLLEATRQMTGDNAELAVLPAGFCGLRLSEVARLRATCFNWTRALRTSFANLCVAARGGSFELQAYMRHRPTSVLAEHYADYSKIDLLRKRV